MFGSGLKWEEFVSAQGRFKVLIPGKPEQYRSPGSEEMSETLMFQFDSARASFMVAFHDRILPDDRPPASDEVERIKRRMLADVGAGPVRYDDIILHNYPGFQIEVASARGVFVTRVYFVLRRVYQLGVDADSNFKEKYRLKFFDSFELTT